MKRICPTRSIDSKEFVKLESLLVTLRAFVVENKSLVAKLGMENKLAETIGEGMGLLLCHEKFGDSVRYEWPGGRKRGYDILLERPGGGKVRIQIKTNKQSEYDFKLFTLDVEESILSQLKIGETEGMCLRFDSEVEGKEADIFLLVHWPVFLDAPTYYVLDKPRLKKAIRLDFHHYLHDKPHHKNYNFGISRKTGRAWPHLNKTTVDSIGEYEKDWSPVVKLLGPKS